jgi:endonuclease G
MPGSAVVHAAVFTAGALIGGGVAAVVTSRRNQQQAPTLPTRVSPAVPVPVPLQQQTTVVRVGGAEVSPVLRYGNPGAFNWRLKGVGWCENLRCI